MIRTLCVLVFGNNSLAQTFPQQNVFSLPIDSNLILAGTFGEIRSNHFHSGIDISTGAEEGKKVMAAADGFVSRIKVSSEGFGKAIYLTHPGGYVTVYGHLQQFNDSLEKYVRLEQYKRESFEVEMFPKENEFIFKQRDVIAYSGNTGGSTGPHLHFEIRDGKTEEPLEPLSSGFKFNDTIAPVINSITVYPLNRNSSVNDTCDKLFVPLRLNGKIVSQGLLQKIIVNGEIGFGVEVTDEQLQNGSNLGLKKIELFIDGEKIYDFSFDRFRFDESRFVNANIDYEEFASSGKTVTLCYRLPGNIFSMTRKDDLSGIVTFNTDESHTGLFRVYDFSSNVSDASFSFISSSKKTSCPQRSENDSTFFISYNKPFIHQTEEIKLSTDKLPAVYDDMYLIISKKNQQEKFFSNTFIIGADNIPVHNAMALSLKPNNLSAALQTKALIVKIENDGRLSSAGGGFSSGFVTAKIRSFGNYAVAIDTIAPTIQATNLSSRSGKRKIKFEIQIKDERSGIGSYRATVNKKWMLMEYDAKTGTLTGETTVEKRNGSNRFVLTVTDKKGNKSKYSSVMKY